MGCENAHFLTRSSCFCSSLKSGSSAPICRGTHRANGKKVAIKCVLRRDFPPSDDAAIYDEVAILSSLDHAYLAPLIDFFDEKDFYLIVMELMSGGDLFHRIGKKKSYSEADARDLSAEMLKAMAYCHQLYIAHCDMKPKNLLLVVSYFVSGCDHCPYSCYVMSNVHVITAFSFSLLEPTS